SGKKQLNKMLNKRAHAWAGTTCCFNRNARQRGDTAGRSDLRTGRGWCAKTVGRPWLLSILRPDASRVLAVARSDWGGALGTDARLLVESERKSDGCMRSLEIVHRTSSFGVRARDG